MSRLRVSLCLLAVLLSGCSVRRFAVHKIGDALASGGSTYESDEDIELVGDALPFSLKLLESLLAEAPRHKGLLQAACQGFATYSYVYVQDQADRLAETDLQAAGALRYRARRLYLRAHRYGVRGLEVGYPGLTEKLLADPRAAVAGVKKKDVTLLYWNAVALGLAISSSKTEAAMLARLPEVDAFLDRALALEEAWNDGALHEFQLILAGARPGDLDFDRAAKHFERARELSQGRRAGLYVAYAETVSVRKQNAADFRSWLEKALALDPDQHEPSRLVNLLAHRRARWLLGRTDDLILPAVIPAAEGERR